MTTPVKVKKIHALIGVSKLTDGNFGFVLDSSLKGLTVNAATYPKPPIDLPTYGAGITAYDGSIPAALDGGKTAVALKNKLRGAAERMYVQLAHYVEDNCDDDMATFLLSGFQAASTTKAAPQPLAQPTIVYVKPGDVTGESKMKIGAVPKARSYDVRYAPVPAGGGMPATWTEKKVTSTKPFVIDSLTPGTVYMFQVCALGHAGLTNWSDPVSRMVV